MSSDPVSDGRHFSFLFLIKAVALAIGFVFFILFPCKFSLIRVNKVLLNFLVGNFFPPLRDPGLSESPY